MSKKREREHSQYYGDVGAENVEEEEECQAEAAGACDCKGCIKRILLNSNHLLAHGFLVNYADNGPGGYGFDVQPTLEVLQGCFEDPDKLRDGGDWICVTEPLSQGRINEMIKDLVEVGDTWTGHCTPEEMRIAWRRWFHLLK